MAATVAWGGVRRNRNRAGAARDCGAGSRDTVRAISIISNYSSSTSAWNNWSDVLNSWKSLGGIWRWVRQWCTAHYAMPAHHAPSHQASLPRLALFCFALLALLT